MRSKAWSKRHTNQKVRRILGSSDWVNGKVSGSRLNNAHWGSGIANKDIKPKHSDDWNDQLPFDVTKDTRYWDDK